MHIISVSPFHDGSACELIDGKVTQYYREERLSRRKHDAQPFLSVNKIVQSLKNVPDFCVVASPDQYDPTLNVWQQYLGKITGCKNVIDMSNEHHLQHANLAYFNSKFDKCLVFVIDRIGSRVADVFREGESVYFFDEGKSKCVYKNFWIEQQPTAQQQQMFDQYVKENSHAEIHATTYGWCRFYESATTLINEHPLNAGKVMGLSAYGNYTGPDTFYKFSPNEELIHDVYQWGERVALWKGIDPTTEITPDNYIEYANVAHAVQQGTQKALLDLVFRLSEKHNNINNICFSGGYAYNVVANGLLTKLLDGFNFYFEPNADDGGNSIGAGMAIHYWQTGNKPQPLEDMFYHGEKQEIELTNALPYDDLKCAEDLSLGKTIAVFYGKSEAGPRALGNRSILHDPRDVDAKESVNEIKKREWYRPFAACVLEEYAHEWFDIAQGSISPYMTESYEVRNPSVIPGVTHIDGSCRIQTVSKHDKVLRPILEEFYKLTGVPVLLNTSLNLHGQPLIETVEQAVDMFEGSYLDVIYFPETHQHLKNKC